MVKWICNRINLRNGWERKVVFFGGEIGDVIIKGSKYG